MDTASIIQLIIQILYVITILGVTAVIISENRNPQKTVSWVLILTFLPVIGLILYVLFGQNHRRVRRINRRMLKGLEGKSLPYFHLLYEKEAPDDAYKKLKRLLKNVGYSPVLDGNKVDFFKEGRDKFDQMFSDIENAQNHIHLLYYKIADDQIGNRLKELLIRKVKEGVDVRIIYDDVGSLKTKTRFFREMEKAGVRVNCFLPIRFPYIARRVNYRNHRKIVVIDGEIGYMGGINIADCYVDGLSWGVWRDLAIRIQGKGVHALQIIFLLDWYYSQKESLSSPAFFPELPGYGSNPMQVVSSGPLDMYENLTEGFFQAINTAKKYVYIQTPYFIPSDQIIEAMMTAAMSGIEVRLVIPERSDNVFVGAATLSYVKLLLAYNVRVYLYTAGFLHSKLVVIDDSLTIIGSANMDVRSFELNFEASTFIYDTESATKAKEIFMNDLKDARLVLPDEWKKRPRIKQYFESVMRLMTPLF